MLQVAPRELVNRIRRALRNKSEPPWFPMLTTELADTAWRRLGSDLSLTRANYGTTRVMCEDSAESRSVAATFGVSSGDGTRQDGIPVELLPKDLAFKCAGQEVRFYEAAEILEPGVSSCVEEALNILNAIPTLLPTVCLLVRSLHLLNPEDDEVDISFSQPWLPFSAFVSVPGPGSTASALRVAEALLHEAMHLQLSLVEAVVPLVVPSGITYFSPWRNEYRTAQGVLHALYVFRVIDAFLGGVSFEDRLHRFANARRATIANQVREIHDFRRSVDLTPDGAALVDRLLDESRDFKAQGWRRSRLPLS